MNIINASKIGAGNITALPVHTDRYGVQNAEMETSQVNGLYNKAQWNHIPKDSMLEKIVVRPYYNSVYQEAKENPDPTYTGMRMVYDYDRPDMTHADPAYWKPVNTSTAKISPSELLGLPKITQRVVFGA